MHIAILSSLPDLSDYIVEMFKTWGLPLCETVEPDRISALDPADAPVLICPAHQGDRTCDDALIAYARRGGTLVCFLPDGALATAAGLEWEGEKEGLLRMRVTAYPAAGLAGEPIPIAARAGTYAHTPDLRALAYLYHPGSFEGESIAIAETDAGRGRILAFAFDLPRSVLVLRQGDPDRTEVIPLDDACARPSHMAAEIGPNDSGWVPAADLLSRLLVDLVRRHIPAPLPLLSHLPGDAPGILLYSGDEDVADVAWNDEEFGCVAEAGGRMNLYIIPIRTKSTPADVARYRLHHDVGPHPNLRPLDGCPVAERLAEFERQIRMFQDMFGVRARSLRNHCTAWAGYMEPVEIMEKLGVRMDGNYFSGTYKRDRKCTPYGAFGASMPMRFCRPDGRLLDVFQQHTHLTDDGMFGPSDYSYKLSPRVFSGVLRRIFTDITTRFHTPYGVCIHPSNWVKFSRPQGQELLRQGREYGLPIWSFDQWSEFWDARDTRRFSGLTWDGARLQFTLEGGASHDALRLAVPAGSGEKPLIQVQLDGEAADRQQVVRYGEEITLVALPPGDAAVSVCAVYGT